MSTVVPSRHDELLASLASLRPGPGGVHLTQVCRQLKAALGVTAVRLVLADGQEFVWPAGSAPARFGQAREVPLTIGAERIGGLILDLRGRLGLTRRLGRRQERLLTDVADLLGPVLRSAQVQDELDRSLESARGHAERVAAVRRRAFGERDAERRDLERDLHDGAQHHLVALGMTLGLLELSAHKQDSAGAQKQLLQLRKGLDRAEAALYTTATGSSPLLQEAGVYPALLAEFRDAGAQVRLETAEWDTSRRYEAPTEMAVYFICLEAVNNARKHAPGARVVVRLADGPAGLTFSVSDDGPGLNRSDLDGSSGVDNMRRRIIAAGGRLQVRASPGAGTTVHGFIPF